MTKNFMALQQEMDDLLHKSHLSDWDRVRLILLRDVLTNGD